MIRRMLLALLFTWCAAAPVSAQTTVTPSRTFVPSMTVPTTGWIGLGPAAGRIVFTDAATDTIGLMTADVGIGTTTPGALLHAVTSTTALGTAIFSLRAELPQGARDHRGTDDHHDGGRAGRGAVPRLRREQLPHGRGVPV
jgi:hypothetical protein